jgi:hypothetical protein
MENEKGNSLSPKMEIALMESRNLLLEYETLVEKLSKSSLLLSEDVSRIRHIADTICENFEIIGLDNEPIFPFLRLTQRLEASKIDLKFKNEIIQICTIFGVFIHESIGNATRLSSTFPKALPSAKELEARLSDLENQLTLSDLPKIGDLASFVDELVNALNKSLKFKIIDKTQNKQARLVAKIYPSLERLLKDILLYRIETIQEREAAGRLDMANVRVVLSIKNDFLLVSIFDDGRGEDDFIEIDEVRQEITKLNGEIKTASLQGLGSRTDLIFSL